MRQRGQLEQDARKPEKRRGKRLDQVGKVLRDRRQGRQGDGPRGPEQEHDDHDERQLQDVARDVHAEHHAEADRDGHGRRKDDEDRQRVERRDHRKRELDAVYQVGIAPINVAARVDGVGHEEPRKHARGEPQQKRLTVYIGTAAHADGQRKPVHQNVHGGLGEQPYLAECGTAIGLDQVDLGQVPDLVAPLPVFRDDLSKRIKHETTLSFHAV